jgi:hypothetical protein
MPIVAEVLIVVQSHLSIIRNCEGSGAAKIVAHMPTSRKMPSPYCTPSRRNFVIDPLKAIAFGRSFELVFGLLLGGSCNIEEATLAVLQDEMEGQGETIGEMAGDGAADAFAGLGDGGGIDMQVDGAVMATDTTRIARDTAKEEEEEEEEAENNKDENRQVALDEARPSETTPQAVWAQRSDISHNAGSVARRQGMLGP